MYEPYALVCICAVRFQMLYISLVQGIPMVVATCAGMCLQQSPCARLTLFILQGHVSHMKV